MKSKNRLLIAKRMVRSLTITEAWDALRKAYPDKVWTDEDIDNMLTELHKWVMENE
jgi:hypothetical protein